MKLTAAPPSLALSTLLPVLTTMAAFAMISPRPEVERATRGAAGAAAKFAREAPRYTAVETIHQRAMVHPHRRGLHFGNPEDRRPVSHMSNREIVSVYGLTPVGPSGELHEVRRIVAIDGKEVENTGAARRHLQSVLAGADSRAKTHLIKAFYDAGLVGAEQDFGQILLLFSKRDIANYTFQPYSEAHLGADRAFILFFKQTAGRDSLRISEGRSSLAQKLEGELWVRVPDQLPLRVALTTTHPDNGHTIRDEARVDYASNAAGALLPAAVVYRRFVDDTLSVENIAQYSAWELR